MHQREEVRLTAVNQTPELKFQRRLNRTPGARAITLIPVLPRSWTRIAIKHKPIRSANHHP